MNEHDHTEPTSAVDDQKPPVDIRKLLPIIEDIMLMVHESLKKVPHVTTNLSKVTERNERVTAEILSYVDHLNDNMGQLADGLSTISSLSQRQEELRQDIDAVITEISEKDPSAVHVRLRTIWQEFESFLSIEGTIQSMQKSIENIQNNATNVVMSLQVQDITAQHMQAINNLIESVHNRLTIILQKFYGAEFQAVIPDSSRKKLSDYIARQSKKIHSHDVLPESEIESQNEIDRMFTEK
jgi:G:T/U-mismatch repair DNA glycosylase